MSYKRADEILPENILEILQTYVSGERFMCLRKRNAEEGGGLQRV